MTRVNRPTKNSEQDPFVYPFSWKDADCAAMDAMFTRARREGLWFYHGGISDPLWFAPDELRAAQQQGRFMWGAVNWSLRAPQDYLAQIEAQMEALKDERQKLLKRMSPNAA